MLFVLDAFDSYHRTHADCILCIMGPVLDKQYADTVFARLPDSNILSLPPNYSSVPTEKKDVVEGVYYLKWG